MSEPHPFEEKEHIPYPEFVVIPPTDEVTYYKQFAELDVQKAGEKVKENIKVLNGIDPEMIKDREERETLIKIRTYLNDIWVSYQLMMENFESSGDAIVDASVLLDNMGLKHEPKDIAPYPVRINKLGIFFNECLSHVSGPTVVLSESHATTVPLLRTLKEQNPESKIAVIVFDTHIDTDPGPADDTPRKQNILRLLIDTDMHSNEPPAEQVVVIGVPDEILSSQVKSDSSPEIYRGYLKVITEDEIYADGDSAQSVSSNLNEILNREVERFAKDGITNVVISLDIDVMQSRELGLTAMEYNPLHALMYLSTLNLESCKSDPQMIYDLLTNSHFAGETSGSILNSPIILGGKGIPTMALQGGFEVIKESCKKFGIEFGIKYKNAQVVGDVVELSGPDYEDRTKKVALEIGRSMAV